MGGIGSGTGCGFQIHDSYWYARRGDSPLAADGIVATGPPHSVSRRWTNGTDALQVIARPEPKMRWAAFNARNPVPGPRRRQRQQHHCGQKALPEAEPDVEARDALRTKTRATAGTPPRASSGQCRDPWRRFALRRPSGTGRPVLTRYSAPPLRLTVPIVLSARRQAAVYRTSASIPPTHNHAKRLLQTSALFPARA